MYYQIFLISLSYREWSRSNILMLEEGTPHESVNNNQQNKIRKCHETNGKMSPIIDERIPSRQNVQSPLSTRPVANNQTQSLVSPGSSAADEDHPISQHSGKKW
jgi:hypothetical protein